MYYSYVYPDYLAHYGVQGMKWGQHLMAKYETNRAGRALRRAASSNNSGNYAKRANKILNKYSTKYSKNEIADAALRTGNRQRRVVNTASTVVKGLYGVGSGYNTAIYGLAALSNPVYASVYAATAATSAASGIGAIALTDTMQKTVNTSITSVDKFVEQYRKS